MTAVAQLRAALPPGCFVDGPSQGVTTERDLCRYDLGEPLVWVRPSGTSEVAAIVRIASETRTPVVAVGARTAYWWPLHYDGAIALDTSGLMQIDAPDDPAEPIWVGAGVSVRELDERLRESGMSLACHPDAYGDTSVAAMVATGFTSGCGVGASDLSSVVAGLRVVIGTGDVLTCGASAVLGGPPFLRGGLPDPTGLFFASDGALGVITEVAVRPQPRVALARLTWSQEASASALAAQSKVAARLRARGLYETFRAVQRWDRGGEEPSTEVDLIVRSVTGAAELEARVEFASAAVERELGVTPRCVERELADGPAAVTRWAGEQGGAWRELGGLNLIGVDVNVPYGALSPALHVSDSVLAEARELPWLSLRRALYAGHDHLNLGIHVALEAPIDGATPGGHELVSRGMGRLAPLDVVPYRMGRLWGAHLEAKVDDTYASVVRAVKGVLDPEGVLHPGASLWGL